MVVATRDRARQNVRFSGCTRSSGAGAGWGSAVDRPKAQEMVGNAMLAVFEDAGRGGRRHGRERTGPGESKAWCLAYSPGTTLETWNMKI